MSLVIVESASKSKTIQKYLNQIDSLKKAGPFKVVASLGHIVDLPPKEIGVDTDTWKLQYEPILKKKKVIKDLTDEVKKAKTVYLASDPDREGEAISWHLKNILKLKNPKRVVFHEITQKALEDAMHHPREIDMDMVHSQESRRALDRVVGFKVSPLLWHRFTGPGLSAGRVQSVVLKNIVERFHNYDAHEAEFYWTVNGTFDFHKTILEADLVKDTVKSKVKFEDPKDALQLLEDIQKKKPTWDISFEFKKSTRNPSAPYTTSALQQEIYDMHKIPAKQTMQLAQKLYEAGYITYMRTDSVNLSKDAIQNIKTYLDDHYKNHFYERTFKSKVANAQEAHECIRPTDMNLQAEALPEDMTASHKKVYDLIWRKAISSQMIPAEYIDVHYSITSKVIHSYKFHGKISLLEIPGYLSVWQPKQKSEEKKIEEWKKLSTKDNKTLFVKSIAEGNITKPEGLYNEPSIIKWMEKEGIGRPSTYSTIIEKLFDKGYVNKGSNPLKTQSVEHYILEDQEITTKEEVLQFGGTEKDRFVPTGLGENIVSYLDDNLPELMNYEFTATLEEQLDEISRKEKTKEAVLQKFYKGFHEAVENAEQEMKEYKKTHAKDPKPKKDKMPSKENILKEFSEVDTNLIRTRYGPALFVTTTKTFISVQPFLQWKQKEIEDISTEDVSFLKKFPITLNPNTTIEYGRYGLYIQSNKKNYRLPKDQWETVYLGKINIESMMKFVS